MFKKAAISLILVGIIYWIWNDKKPIDQSTDIGDADVLIFTIDRCGDWCDKTISELTKRNVSYSNIMVDVYDPESDNVKLFKKYGGERSFPFVVSGNERVNGHSKANLLSLLAQRFGEKYLTDIEKKYFKKHFYSNGKPRVVMYGVVWCPYCKKLRKQFADDSMDYIEIDVEKSGEKEKMTETMGIEGYPSTWVGYIKVQGSTISDVKRAM